MNETPRNEPYSPDELREGDRPPVESDKWPQAPAPGTADLHYEHASDAGTVFEQEADLGRRGGGEVDEETMRASVDNAEARRIGNLDHLEPDVDVDEYGEAPGAE